MGDVAGGSPTAGATPVARLSAFFIAEKTLDMGSSNTGAGTPGAGSCSVSNFFPLSANRAT